MACKQLTFEGKFESGILDLCAGKVYAFVAVLAPGRGETYQLGIAVANEAGYHPVPLHWAHADTMEEMQAEATRLNAEMGLDEGRAALIVASSMCAQNRRRRVQA
jgi:hypothetical protein